MIKQVGAKSKAVSLLSNVPEPGVGCVLGDVSVLRHPRPLLPVVPLCEATLCPSIQQALDELFEAKHVGREGLGLGLTFGSRRWNAWRGSLKLQGVGRFYCLILLGSICYL